MAINTVSQPVKAHKRVAEMSANSTIANLMKMKMEIDKLNGMPLLLGRPTRARQ